MYGNQGICSSSEYLNKWGIIVANTVVIVSNRNLVPVRLFNVTNESIMIPKGKLLSTFEILNQIIVQNMQLSEQSGDEQVDSKFLSYFEMPENLSDKEEA